MEGKAERVLAEDDYARLRSGFSIGPNPDAVPRSVVDHFTKSLARPGRLSAALNYYRANLSSSTGWAGLADELQITMPTQLLWGDQDPALGRRGAEWTAAHVKGEYRLEVLDGAGHWLQFERPDEVSRSLTRLAIH
jgi:pimeloyl-ACP methyl ester carboxylesterase